MIRLYFQQALYHLRENVGFRIGYGIGHLHDYGACHHFSGAAHRLRTRSEPEPIVICVCHVCQE